MCHTGNLLWKIVTKGSTGILGRNWWELFFNRKGRCSKQLGQPSLLQVFSTRTPVLGFAAASNPAA